MVQESDRINMQIQVGKLKINRIFIFLSLAALIVFCSVLAYTRYFSGINIVVDRIEMVMATEKPSDTLFCEKFQMTNLQFQQYFKRVRPVWDVEYHDFIWHPCYYSAKIGASEFRIRLVSSVINTARNWKPPTAPHFEGVTTNAANSPNSRWIAPTLQFPMTGDWDNFACPAPSGKILNYPNIKSNFVQYLRRATLGGLAEVIHGGKTKIFHCGSDEACTRDFPFSSPPDG